MARLNMPRVKDISITSQLSVGLTKEMETAIAVITAFNAVTPSQYGRRAILNQLVNDGLIQHPAQRLAETNNAKSA
jgi:hypothetical protein